MIVYLVVDNDSAGRAVHGVFSTLEKAEKYIAGRPYLTIWYYELDCLEILDNPRVV